MLTLLNIPLIPEENYITIIAHCSGSEGTASARTIQFVADFAITHLENSRWPCNHVLRSEMGTSPSGLAEWLLWLAPKRQRSEEWKHSFVYMQDILWLVQSLPLRLHTHLLNHLGDALLCCLFWYYNIKVQWGFSQVLFYCVLLMVLADMVWRRK